MFFFDTYLQLSEEEEQKVLEEVREMSAKEADKVMEIINSYERRGRELGKEEGKIEGKLEAIRMVAKRINEKGRPTKEIAEMTGLEIKEIERL
ncbi:transposase [Neobacillus novalis]|nr:transposase [Neobacillus novalis]